MKINSNRVSYQRIDKDPLEQKVITENIHQIPIHKVDSHALYIMEKLKVAGFTAYLVGGSVRDLLLKQKPKDYDISTSARPEDIKKLFRNCILIGRRFRLAHIRFGKKIYEVSTFRSGDPKKEDLILRDNQWGYPEEDALRRDFTINGLFYDPSSETIIDYVNGYEDIEKKYLQTIGDPFIRFKQDPVRMLRLLKFQARLGFEVDPDTHIALLDCREDIVKSAPARVFEEMLRMLESGAAKPFIELLAQHGFLDHLLPPVASFIEKDSDIYNYLAEIDIISRDPFTTNLERPVLLSSFAYPILQKRLQIHFLEREKIPHLGEIQTHSKELLQELFGNFFLVPKKIRASLINILLGQYRLTPLHKKRSRKKRIPRESDFDLALKFLNLRVCLEPGLKKIYEDWNQIYSVSATENKKPSGRQRKRRRKKR